MNSSLHKNSGTLKCSDHDESKIQNPHKVSPNFEIKENEDYFVFPTKVYEEFIKEFKKQLKSIVSLQNSNSFYKMLCFYSYLLFFLVLLVQLYFYLNR